MHRWLQKLSRPIWELCWALSVPMLCSEHSWKPWVVGSCQQQTATLPLLLLIFFSFAPGILSLLPSLRNKPRRYKTTSERDLAQWRWLQSNMNEGRVTSVWSWASTVLKFGLEQGDNRPPCRTISIGFQTSTPLSERLHSLLNIRGVRWDLLVRKIWHVLKMETLLNTWVSLKGDVPKCRKFQTPQSPRLLWALLLRLPVIRSIFKLLPCKLHPPSQFPSALMLPFSNSKCHFLPPFVWLFRKLSLSLLAFPQTLKGNWVASSYCRCHHGAHGFCQLFLPPLMLLKSNSSCKGGPRAHCDPREQAPFVLPVKAQQSAAGADNGRHKGPEITHWGGEAEKDRQTSLEFSAWEE